MSAKDKSSKSVWVDPDDAPEWADEVWDRAEFAFGEQVVRPASGTLTRRGRPPVGDEPKQQVTLRLAPKVLRYFKQSGEGWQTRLNETLERYVSGASSEQLDDKTAAGSALSQRLDNKAK